MLLPSLPSPCSHPATPFHRLTPSSPPTPFTQHQAAQDLIVHEIPNNPQYSFLVPECERGLKLASGMLARNPPKVRPSLPTSTPSSPARSA